MSFHVGTYILISGSKTIAPTFIAISQSLALALCNFFLSTVFIIIIINALQKKATNWRCKYLMACPISTVSRCITHGHNAGGLTDLLIADYITIIFCYGHFPHSCDCFSLLDFTCSQQLHHRQNHSDKWWSLQGVQTAAQLEHCKTPNHLSKEMQLSVSLPLDQVPQEATWAFRGAQSYASCPLGLSLGS